MTSNPTYDTFRRKMRFLRQQAGLSQEALAHKMGCSISTISENERGAKAGVPKQPFVVALDRALDGHGELIAAAGYRIDEPMGGEFDPTADTELQVFQDLFRSFWFQVERELIALKDERDMYRARAQGTSSTI